MFLWEQQNSVRDIMQINMKSVKRQQKKKINIEIKVNRKFDNRKLSRNVKKYYECY